MTTIVVRQDTSAVVEVTAHRGEIAVVSQDVGRVVEVVTAGPRGPRGEQGEAGPAGAQGETGPQGPAGPQGPQGETGATGATGPQGPAGPQGETGPQGPQGIQGIQGIQGATGAPGPQGDTGPAGAAGTDGRTWLSGSGAPSNAIGEDGDFYLDTSASAYHGPKAAGAWPSGVSLVGATGATGAEGPQGDPGPQGPQGDAGATGPAGPGLSFADSMWLSMLFVQGSNPFPWTTSTINGGTMQSVLGPTQAPGANRLSSATGASGYRVQTGGQLRGAAGLAQRIVLLPWGESAVTIRAGFHDTTLSTAPTDGAYFEIAGTTLTGRVRNNTSETATVGSYTVAAGTWYVLDIDYTADDAVRFVVSELVSGTKVFDETVSGSNVPNSTTRTFIQGIVAHDSDASSAKAMCDLAYFGFGPSRPNYCPVPP